MKILKMVSVQSSFKRFGRIEFFTRIVCIFCSFLLLFLRGILSDR